MTPADIITLLDIMYEVKIGLHADGVRLDVRGPAETLPLLVPMLKARKAALIAFLRATAPQTQRTAP